MSIEAKLEEIGLTLPQPLKAPPGVVLPFSWVRVRGNRAFVSGHHRLECRRLDRAAAGQGGCGVNP